jgi:Flp pilus assembly pilin Flp
MEARGNSKNCAENEETMQIQLLNAWVRLHRDEAGQGLVEYVLILALVAFAAVTGMNSLATGLNSAFLAVGSMLTSALG